MEPDLSALQEEASSVDSRAPGHSGLFISNVIIVGCRIAPLIFRWRTRARCPRSRGVRPLKSVSCYRALPRIYPFFFFPSAANKYPPPASLTSPRYAPARSLGTNTWCSINIARIGERDEILYYTYIRRNRLARIVQTRDARTVNPDENKPDAKNDQRICWTVVSVNIACEWYMARCELHGKTNCVALFCTKENRRVSII